MARLKDADERPAEADALKEQLEEIEGFDASPGVEKQPAGQPYITDDSIERALIGSPTQVAVTDRIASATAALPTRSDDEGPRTLVVALIADANGTDSRLTLEGAGVGGHRGYTRVWPDDQLHEFEFDGDHFEQTLKFVATHALVVIDESNEIRVGVPPTD